MIDKAIESTLVFVSGCGGVLAALAVGAENYDAAVVCLLFAALLVLAAIYVKLDDLG